MTRQSRDHDQAQTSAGRSIRVVAAIPLIRTGLEHAAKISGFDLVQEGEADVWLLEPGQASPKQGIVIVANGTVVAVRLYEPPATLTWQGIGVLVSNLLLGDSIERAD
jgi:hypothetical protein